VWDVFLSHSSADAQFARRLANDLGGYGVSVWVDERELHGGAPLRLSIEQGIQGSAFFVLLLSPASVNSDWVRVEIDAAFTREMDEKRIMIVPVLHKECSIPLLLRDKIYVDFTDDYEGGLRKLVATLLNGRAVMRNAAANASNLQLYEVVQRRLQKDPPFRRVLTALLQAAQPSYDPSPSPDQEGLLTSGIGRASQQSLPADRQAHRAVRPVRGALVVPAEDYENMLPYLRDEFVPIIGSVAAGPGFSWNEYDFPPEAADRYVQVKGEAPGGFAMQVEGRSMEPELPDGCIALFGGRIQLDDKEPHGRPALAVYEDNSGKLRYAVKMISADKTTVRMSPLNAKSYRDLEIPRERLHALYAVIGPITP